MTYPPAIKNITAGQFKRALEQEGFSCKKRGKRTSIYRHPDGRRVKLDFHHSGDTFPPKTLKRMLTDARWTTDDLKRLKLIPKRG
jgi:predicted RNA binding protein YcfA (HicA-like mRNA interferase family)